MDLLKLNAARACNVLHHLLMRNKDEKGRVKTERWLLTPPPDVGRAADPRFSEKAMAAAWESAAAGA